ncbi:MAG TPA: GNAT family N-acetyltransferase [Jatrophihabitantaceae bacterium]|nr:GNAT family N-acetyltransferase [Jatrophihabitantaceae bacterium]
MTPLHIEAVDWDEPDAVALRAAQRIDIDGRYGADTEPGAKPTADDISVFLLARNDDGEAVGCGALRQLGESSAEIKRMFVPTSFRRQGISRALLGALEAAAIDRGWTTVRLETGTLQHEAIGLYESAGYVRIPNFGAYIGEPYSLCYERTLR